jgi:hypothetical protein
MTKADRDLLAIRLASDVFYKEAFHRDPEWNLSWMPDLIKTRVRLSANAHGIPEKHHALMVEMAIQHYNHFLRDVLTVLVELQEKSG